MADYPRALTELLASARVWEEETKALSLRAKGAWANLRYTLCEERNEGMLTHELTAISRLIGASGQGADAVLRELSDCGVCAITKSSNGNVTVLYRRAVELYKARESSRLRVEKLREKQRCNGVAWPETDLWLKKYLETQRYLLLPVGINLFDPVWWERISGACNGISIEFLNREFAKIGNWIENPQKNPPAAKMRNGLPNIGGWKNFVGGWLVRAKEKERRYGKAPLLRTWAELPAELTPAPTGKPDPLCSRCSKPQSLHEQVAAAPGLAKQLRWECEGFTRTASA